MYLFRDTPKVCTGGSRAALMRPAVRARYFSVANIKIFIVCEYQVIKAAAGRAALRIKATAAASPAVNLISN